MNRRFFLSWRAWLLLALAGGSANRLRSPRIIPAGTRLQPIYTWTGFLSRHQRRRGLVPVPSGMRWIRSISPAASSAARSATNGRSAKLWSTECDIAWSGTRDDHGSCPGGARRAISVATARGVRPWLWPSTVLPYFTGGSRSVTSTPPAQACGRQPSARRLAIGAGTEVGLVFFMQCELEGEYLYVDLGNFNWRTQWRSRSPAGTYPSPPAFFAAAPTCILTLPRAHEPSPGLFRSR